MSTEIDTRVTADLHPQIIDTLPGVTADMAVHVGQAVDALTSAYTYVGSIYDMRDAAFADPELTPEGALLKVDDYANAKLAAVTTKIDGAVKNMTRSIDALTADMKSAVKELAGKQVSGEVRAHIKAAGPDRIKLLEQAVADKDTEVLSSVCGAPPMLSGISKEMHEFFTLRYNEMTKPETAKRLKALTAARDHLNERGGLVLREMMKAVGTVPIITQDKAGISRISGHIRPQDVRAKRNASRDVYKKLA